MELGSIFLMASFGKAGVNGSRILSKCNGLEAMVAVLLKRCKCRWYKVGVLLSSMWNGSLNMCSDVARQIVAGWKK